MSSNATGGSCCQWAHIVYLARAAEERSADHEIAWGDAVIRAAVKRIWAYETETCIWPTNANDLTPS